MPQEPQVLQASEAIIQTMTTPVTATAINPFHSDLDITTDAGKNFWTTAIKGLDESSKYNGDKIRS